MDLKKINKELSTFSPEEIIKWGLNQAKKPVLTTNFRPYEVAILHAITKVAPKIKVIWCDTGYNTPNTYRHAYALIDSLSLNIQTYVPRHSTGYRDVVMGIPELDTPAHDIFTEEVKLEPFKRAMNEHQPDVWFTNLRKGQTAFRDEIGVVSLGLDGILKISPFYYFSDTDLDLYLEKYKLPNEFNYFDPTKGLQNRECGLHKSIKE